MKIEEALDELITEGERLAFEFEKKNGSIWNYQTWYTRARRVVEQVLPERAEEFVAQYAGKKPGEQGKMWTDYGIDERLKGVRWGAKEQPSFDHEVAATMRFVTQYHILKAARAVIADELSNISAMLEARLFDSELEAASSLAEKGHLRAAGVVAGVVLEAHLKAVCERKSIEIKGKHPTLADYNDSLRTASVYDVSRWRKNQHLADLRNLCGHKKEREPTIEDVRELIEGVGAATKAIG